MNYTTKYLSPAEYPIWDDFVKKQPESHLFSTTNWLIPMLVPKNLKLKILVCLHADKIVGGFAFGYRKSFGVFNVIDIAAVTPYNGIIIEKSLSKYASKHESDAFEINQLIINELEKTYHRIIFQTNIDLIDVRPYTWAGYSAKVQYTYMENVSGPTSFMDYFNPEVKNKIKKSQKTNYKIVTGDSDAILEDFWKLQQMTFNRKELKLAYQREHFFNLLKSIKPAVRIKVFLAYIDDVPASGRLQIFDKNISYDWAAGSNPAFFSSGINQHLVLEVLNSLKEDNIKLFDFCGANTAGVAGHKSAYNMKLIPYFTISKNRGAIFRFLWYLKMNFLR